MSYNDWTLSYKKILATFPRLPSSATRILQYAIGVLGFLGFLDATYLTLLHYKNAIPPCTIHGCEVVLSSSYATIAGIPISLIGVVYYLTVVVFIGILFQASESLKAKLTTWLVLLTGSGLLVGVFLVILQAFVLHAFCQYCLASEVIDFLLFDCAWWLWRRNG